MPNVCSENIHRDTYIYVMYTIIFENDKTSDFTQSIGLSVFVGDYYYRAICIFFKNTGLC